ASISPTPATSTRPTDNGVLDLSKQVMAAPTTQAIANNVTLSTVDHFLDQMAYRDAVNAVIREKELDDTHDLYGGTLYTLKFDSAVLPGVHSESPVIVLLTLSGTAMTPDEIDSLYPKWIAQMQAHIEHEDAALDARVRLNKLETDDVFAVQDYLFTA